MSDSYKTLFIALTQWSATALSKVTTADCVPSHSGCENSLHALGFDPWGLDCRERAVKRRPKTVTHLLIGYCIPGVKKISLWRASNYMRWAERLIPSFSILCRSVFGCIPRVLAAPFAPSITPRVFAARRDVSPLDLFQRLQYRRGVRLAEPPQPARAAGAETLIRSVSNSKIGPRLKSKPAR